MANAIKDNMCGQALQAGNAATKVLIVDDEQDILTVMSYMFRKAGYDVRTAAEGRKALDAVEEDGIELVMLDYMLPDINGLEVLSCIKKSHPEIDVIIVTGHGNETLRADVISAGASGYVVKPFMNDKLIGLANDTVTTRRARSGQGGPAHTT